MSELWSQLVESLRLDLLGYLLLAVVLGGAVGLERELRGKPAGLRTNILICVGAALFTQLSVFVAGSQGDPGRITAQIVTGVGFLGAGTILHSRGEITGLTSAATIWMVAAIGVAVGSGALLEASGATLLVVVVLGALGALERYLKRRYGGSSHVVLDTAPEPGRVGEIENLVRAAGLEIDHLHSRPEGDHLVVEFVMSGPVTSRKKVRLHLLEHSGISRVSVVE